MTRVYLIRHGEAEGNIYRRAQGDYESRITAKGERQIAALAERFRSEHIDALYSSDRKRTRFTAGAITKYHPLEILSEPRLREISLGPWEDVPFGDLRYRYPELMRVFNDDPDRWFVDGAETFPHLRARMTDAVRDIAARHDGQTVVCVSHGMAIRSLLSGIMGVPSEEIARMPHGDNTAVSLLEVENGEMRIVFSNDASHLPQELSTFARQSWWRKAGAVDLNNVRFRRLDPREYPSQYIAYYEKTWRAVHGNLDGFQPQFYLAAAVRRAAAFPDAVVTIVRPDDEVVGIAELDTEREKELGIGWLCLCYVEEPYRRLQLGAQLIGHAVSVFRRLGRRAIRLCVYEGNTGALQFYEEFGFHAVGETEGVSSRLLIMEKELN